VLVYHDEYTKVQDVVYFFFSSRRRHTRSKRDWSSRRVLFRSQHQTGQVHVPATCISRHPAPAQTRQSAHMHMPRRSPEWDPATRSEERRVGKECRSRESKEHEKKKKGQ